MRYRVGPDGSLDRLEETATGVFTDMTLLPVVFPGFMEEVETHLVPRPGDDRIIDIDYCNNASAIYHVEPIDDMVIREWGEDGRIAGRHDPAGPLRARRLRAAAPTRSRC